MMRTDIYIRNISLMAMLALPLALFSQEDETKKNSLNRELTLEKEYVPSVGDASKVNALPTVKDAQINKVAVSYSDYTVPVEPAKEYRQLGSGTYMTQMEYNKRRGYLHFGMGSYLNMNGDVGYHIVDNATDQFSIFFTHQSTNGNVKYVDTDDKVKAKSNDNKGGLAYSHDFDRLKFYLDGSYAYNTFNYYGFNATEFDTETNQVHQALTVHSGVQSHGENPVNYLFDVRYVNFKNKYGYATLVDGPTEHNVDATLDLNAALPSSSIRHYIGVGGYLKYLNYDTTDPDNAYNSHAIITANPYYKIDGDNWHLRLGVKAMFSTGNENKNLISPDVSVDFNPADGLVFYAYATGEMRPNDLYSLMQENRYIYNGQSYLPSRNSIDAQLGLRMNAGGGFWFGLFGGYQKTKEDMFFNIYSYVLNRDSIAASVSKNTFDNQSRGNSFDSERFLGGVNLKYSYRTLLDFELKGVYNHWSVKYPSSVGDMYEAADYADPKAYGKPEFELTASLTVRPIRHLSIDARYYMATGRYGRVLLYDPSYSDYYPPYSPYKNIKMKDINELNLRGTYDLNDTFGFYVQANNVLFQKYEYVYGYPLQRFSIMGGFNINF